VYFKYILHALYVLYQQTHKSELSLKYMPQQRVSVYMLTLPFQHF